MFYVYILESLEYPNKHYTGFTKDLKKRIEKHNNGEVTHTTKYKPWKIITYLAFEQESKAREFERYLKTHSGRSFSQKHF
ncbi:MAG TPA: GIY-YIG nuclease family protein [Candidatus Cloacimonadota bacterium]|nr:GIY-YIG nuclease family protein [Candidatus Cloacimonadota bacterium]